MTGKQSEAWHIGVIGGSGLSAGIALEESPRRLRWRARWRAVRASYYRRGAGRPSFTFIARHGAGHAIPPGDVSAAPISMCSSGAASRTFWRCRPSARCAGWRRATMSRWISSSTARRAGKSSFFGPGVVGHVSLADPVCPRLASLAAAAARAADGTDPPRRMLCRHRRYSSPRPARKAACIARGMGGCHRNDRHARGASRPRAELPYALLPAW